MTFSGGRGCISGGLQRNITHRIFVNVCAYTGTCVRVCMCVSAERGLVDMNMRTGESRTDRAGHRLDTQGRASEGRLLPESPLPRGMSCQSFFS